MGVKYHAKLLIAIALLWVVTIYLWPNPGFLLLFSVPFFIPVYIGHRSSQFHVVPSFPKNLKFVVMSFFYNCLFTLTPIVVGDLINNPLDSPSAYRVWETKAFLSILSFATAFIALVPPSVEKRNRAYPSGDL